jgi:PilZ domain
MSVEPQASHEPPAKNRRRSRRHKLDVPATLIAQSDNTSPISIKITHLSVGGVGLICLQPLTLGEVYLLRAFDSLLPSGTRLQIVSCRSANNGGFEIGAQTV